MFASLVSGLTGTLHVNNASKIPSCDSLIKLLVYLLTRVIFK